MRISILVAAHNEGPALLQTVRSVVETVGDLDYEIVLADDASTDTAVAETVAAYPQVRLVQHARRLGASPTKDAAARAARGDVLLFLDGHTNPAPGALARLVESLDACDGNAIITPAVPQLDVATWTNSRTQIGHGFGLRLDNFACWWIPLEKLTPRTISGRSFYETPALIGCALAVPRAVYDRLLGFDPHMRSWGLEDLDFGLKAWLCGIPVLHDPAAVVGHRFRATFNNYAVPPDHIAVNEFRTARKHLSDPHWTEWLEMARLRHVPGDDRPPVIDGRLTGASTLPHVRTPVARLEHPEGRWANLWTQFLLDRASIEQERAYLLSRRQHDEVWFARKFNLAWPIWPQPTPVTYSHRRPCSCSGTENAHPATGVALSATGPDLIGPDGGGPSPSPQPSPMPSPMPSPAPCDCELTGIELPPQAVPPNRPLTLTAFGKELDCITWSAPQGTPATGMGVSFTTQWATVGTGRQITAICHGTTRTRTVDVVKLSKLQYSMSDGKWYDAPPTLHVCQGARLQLRVIGTPDVLFSPDWQGATKVTTNPRLADVDCSRVSPTNEEPFVVSVNWDRRITLDVVVHQVESRFVPKEQFEGRSQQRLGLGEQADLSTIITPPIALDQLGGLVWKISDRLDNIFSGTLMATGPGSAVFDATYKPSTAGIKTPVLLQIATGPAKGHQLAEFLIEVVAPSEGYVELMNFLPIKHTQGVPSIKFWCRLFVGPKDVSFHNIIFREGSSPCIGTGGYTVEKNHPIGEWKNLGFGNIEFGTIVDLKDGDEVKHEDAHPGIEPGTFRWEIPWEYSVPKKPGQDSPQPIQAPIEFTKVIHSGSKNAAGDVTLQKGGCGPYTKKLNDPDS